MGTCSNCVGSGKERCTDCGGSGEQICHYCGSTGYNERDPIAYILGNKCRNCGGSGYERCSYCTGSGKRICHSCKGSGDKQGKAFLIEKDRGKMAVDTNLRINPLYGGVGQGD